MEPVRRPAVYSLSIAAVLFTAVGGWLHHSAGRDAAPGLVRYAAVTVGTAALGSLILWHRPRNRYGAIHLSIGVLFGGVVLAAGVLSRAGGSAALPAWTEELALAWSWISPAALLPLWVMAIACFPDGAFHRKVVKRFTVTLAVVMPVLAVLAYATAPPGEPPPLIRVELPSTVVGPLAPAGDPHLLYRVTSLAASVLGSAAPLAAVVALLDRFRHAGPVLRQQIKWLLLGAAISVALQAVPVQAIESEAVRTVGNVLVILAVPLPLVAAAMAIFRYGLWEIDVVISKGLVYTLASGVLTALFLGVAFVAGVTVGGRDSRVVAALGLALFVSFLAEPLRQRLEKVVARVIYGNEPRGLMALAQLAGVLAPSLDARQLGSRIADVARGALGASWAGVWLHVASVGSGTLRPLAVSGSEPGPAAVLPASAVDGLMNWTPGAVFADLPVDATARLRPLFMDEPVLLAPMTSNHELVGLIACGRRPKDSFASEDVELLGVLARESALALRTIRLEEELRQRLEQIEQQALELHNSRQRLVTAEDQERRRIERDLHDGAQQQLVALAAHLRAAARVDGGAAGGALEQLADEAEEAVFALQELARGIYPSLLADRGLHAALQAHAARLPANVRVEVGPLMSGRRLDPDLEAALYFVGLEAMTNAIKHAPRARILVSLRADRGDRSITLEVHDDGPGFDAKAATPASGLQNMADRIEAVGGALSVETRPGSGTWVRAQVHERADVRPIRRREATPGGR